MGAKGAQGHGYECGHGAGSEEKSVHNQVFVLVIESGEKTFDYTDVLRFKETTVWPF
jgi:hypothetical protein